MNGAEVDLLERAHRLFASAPQPVSLHAELDRHAEVLQRTADAGTGVGLQCYREMALAQRAQLVDSARTDSVVTAVLAAAAADHSHAHQQTHAVLAAARADPDAANTALEQREAMRRRAARLRTQHAHVDHARLRAQTHDRQLRRLRYRGARRINPGRVRLPHNRAGLAVRAALSRLGKPYVWGATGPDRFDCSGLTQWAYHQAGVPLTRTTYTQIHEGIPVPRSQIQPGDLIFPSSGHVQLAIGNNLVIEAPHAGATVQISPLGAAVAIRRLLR